MRTALLAIAVLGLASLSGCHLHHRGHSGGHVSTDVSVGVGLDYTYFPTFGAYYHESSGHWWVDDGGSWVSLSVRPPRIVITDETPWVVVKVEGDSPHVRYSDHSRDYPSSWKGDGPKGPPPGRGWRK
jgi:hypothetical protein